MEMRNILNGQEYESWLSKYKDIAVDYFYANDIAFKTMDMSASAYNALRLNDKHYMSDIVFESNSDIEKMDFMKKSAADEINLFRRNYLRKHRKALTEYVAKKLSATEDANNDSAEEQLSTAGRTIIKKLSAVAGFSDNNMPTDNDISAKEMAENARNLIVKKISGIAQFETSSEIENEAAEKTDTVLTEATSDEIATIIDKKQVEDIQTSEAAENSNSNIPQAGMSEDIDVSQLTPAVIKELLHNASAKEKIIQILMNQPIEIEKLGLSGRSRNCLKRDHVDYLHQLLSFYPDNFLIIRNLGAKSVIELRSVIENKIIEFFSNKDIDSNEFEEVNLQKEEDWAIPELSDECKKALQKIKNMLCNESIKNEIVRLFMSKNISIGKLNLSVRSFNCLNRSGVLYFHQIIDLYPDGFYKIRNLGAKSIEELLSVVENTVAAYYGVNQTELYSDNFIREKVLSCFDDIGFKGLSFKEMKSAFPEEIEDSRIKNTIGKLIADKKLEYVDFRCYKVYPSVTEVLEQSCLPDDDKKIVNDRLNGITLEAVAQDMGLTRERVRQRFHKNIEKLKRQLISDYNVSLFDEDYYAHLYSVYEGSKELWHDFLNIPSITIEYLTNTYSKGKNKIESALADAEIDLNLKFKIQNYLNRNKILLDGVFVEKNRVDIEDFIMSKICNDELSFDAFSEKYNSYLEENGIPYDEKIYYTEELRRTRGNRLAASMKCLWKHGEKMRYYDIAAHDYTELLETLNLESFQNIEISTLKFIEDYPDVMKKYDIRDQYELHNLLKKIIDTNDYHDMVFNRQPVIQFGEFDRDKAIYDIFEIVAPVTAEELAEYLNMEYGYEKSTMITNCLKVLSQYYHNGIYSIDFKKIPDSRVTVFKEMLTEDFYYVSEIKKLYAEMFADADVEEINPRSLKTIGFNVYSKYALQNHTSLHEYFKYLLTKDDIYNIADYRNTYGQITMYSQTVLELKKDFEIFAFEKDQMITFKRLSKIGISKKDLIDYCDCVYDFVEDETYFTIESLNNAGFSAEIYELGFDSYFYSNILAMSEKFTYAQIFGKIVLYKGNSKSEISKKMFILEQLANYDYVDMDEFINDCADLFGMNITDRYDITRAVNGTEYYYDSIMERIYRNKEIYYSEFDD